MNSKTYIVYGQIIQEGKLKEKVVMNVYSNEYEALKECNYLNENSKSVVYYTKPIEIINTFNP